MHIRQTRDKRRARLEALRPDQWFEKSVEQAVEVQLKKAGVRPKAQANGSALDRGIRFGRAFAASASNLGVG